MSNINVIEVKISSHDPSLAAISKVFNMSALSSADIKRRFIRDISSYLSNLDDKWHYSIEELNETFLTVCISKVDGMFSCCIYFRRLLLPRGEDFMSHKEGSFIFITNDELEKLIKYNKYKPYALIDDNDSPIKIIEFYDIGEEKTEAGGCFGNIVYPCSSVEEIALFGIENSDELKSGHLCVKYSNCLIKPGNKINCGDFISGNIYSRFKWATAEVCLAKGVYFRFFFKVFEEDRYINDLEIRKNTRIGEIISHYDDEKIINLRIIQENIIAYIYLKNPIKDYYFVPVDDLLLNQLILIGRTNHDARSRKSFVTLGNFIDKECPDGIVNFRSQVNNYIYKLCSKSPEKYFIPIVNLSDKRIIEMNRLIRSNDEEFNIEVVKFKVEIATKECIEEIRSHENKCLKNFSAKFELNRRLINSNNFGKYSKNDLILIQNNQIRTDGKSHWDTKTKETMDNINFLTRVKSSFIRSFYLDGNDSLSISKDFIEGKISEIMTESLRISDNLKSIIKHYIFRIDEHIRKRFEIHEKELKILGQPSSTQDTLTALEFTDDYNDSDTDSEDIYEYSSSDNSTLDIDGDSGSDDIGTDDSAENID